jgi:hypothetical protein
MTNDNDPWRTALVDACQRALLRRLPAIMAVLAVFAVILAAMLVWGYLL